MNNLNLESRAGSEEPGDDITSVLEDYVIETPLPGSKDTSTRYLSLQEAEAEPLSPIARRKRKTIRYQPHDKIMMAYWIDHIEEPQKPRDLGMQIGDFTTNRVKNKVTKYIAKLSEDPMWGGLLYSGGSSSMYRVHQLGARPETPQPGRQQRNAKKLLTELLGRKKEIETTPDMGNSGLKFEVIQGQLRLSHRDTPLDIYGQTLKVFTEVAEWPGGTFFDTLHEKVNTNLLNPINSLQLMGHLEYIQEVLAEQGISEWSDQTVISGGRRRRLIRFDTRSPEVDDE